MFQRQHSGIAYTRSAYCVLGCMYIRYVLLITLKHSLRRSKVSCARHAFAGLSELIQNDEFAYAFLPLCVAYWLIIAIACAILELFE